jgi:cobalt-zinc-cadmium efflux system outer membrane protein
MTGRWFFFFLLLPFMIKAQAVRSLSLQQVDSLFLKNNLLLLAQEFNIEAQQAFVLQARAYPNPVFVADVNAIDSENKKYFHTNASGQKVFAVEQLILLGGKRQADIKIARQNKKLAMLELEDLLRSLQFQVHSGFYQLNRQLSTLTKFNRQLQLLDTLIASYDAQARRGNLPPKDVIRLKSVYFKINNEKSALASEYHLQQQQLQQLLQSSDYIVPRMTESDFEAFLAPQMLEDLQLAAVASRPDLKMAHEQEELAMLQLSLQKKLAIPDVALTTSYDQRGGAFVNQVNIGLAIPLPLWNRNRGNIKAAEYFSRSSHLYYQQKAKEVEAEVLAAWQNMRLSVSEYQKIRNYYTQDFEEVFNGVNQNFQKRNISILEFVDFFESYNESQSELERVRNFLANSAMQINFVTATKIF